MQEFEVGYRRENLDVVFFDKTWYLSDGQKAARHCVHTPYYRAGNFQKKKIMIMNNDIFSIV